MRKYAALFTTQPWIISHNPPTLGRGLEKVLTVVHQLINGLLHISQRCVPLLLFE
jgi:hypothetical protein